MPGGDVAVALTSRLSAVDGHAAVPFVDCGSALLVDVLTDEPALHASTDAVVVVEELVVVVEVLVVVVEALVVVVTAIVVPLAVVGF